MPLSTYHVTFRVADKAVNGTTYSQRRQSIIDAVREEGTGYWEETTSFFLMESKLSTEAFAKAASAGLSVKDDLLLVYDPSDMSASYFGPFAHVDVLKSFFPKLKKVP